MRVLATPGTSRRGGFGKGRVVKRWLRRTGKSVKGEIESRGVESVFPVGGEPGAQARKIARCGPARGDGGERSARV